MRPVRCTVCVYCSLFLTPSICYEYFALNRLYPLRRTFPIAQKIRSGVGKEGGAGYSLALRSTEFFLGELLGGESYYLLGHQAFHDRGGITSNSYTSFRQHDLKDKLPLVGRSYERTGA